MKPIFSVKRIVGIGLLGLSLGGMIGPLSMTMRLEAGYQTNQLKNSIIQKIEPTPIPLPPAIPSTFNPLLSSNSSEITPINTDFSIIVPKIGINAPIIANINPLDEISYEDALSQGVAHSNLSYFPDENGTVYLFSHSTNYEWFVKDLNAVFYLLKELTEDDYIVLFYKGKRYTYQVSHKEVVASDEIAYLTSQAGEKNLVLQTCWPPGTTIERLLIFGKLIDVS